MTCIVGVVEPAGVLLAADSMTSDVMGCDLMVAGKAFVAELGDGRRIGVATAGNPRIGQVFEHCVDWDQLSFLGDATETWLFGVLVPLLRLAAVEHGFPLVDGEAGTVDANLLVAVAGRLFEVHSRWQVVERPRRWSAIGSGFKEASGVMWALAGSELPAGVMAERAIAAAAAFNDGVGGDVRFWWVAA